MLRPQLILAANAVCLASNIVAAVAESDRYNQFVDICAKVDHPTDFGVIGMTGPVAVAVIGILIITALSILMTIAWFTRKRSRRGWSGPVTGAALFLTAFSLVNILLAYAFDLRFLTYHVSCSGGA